MKSVPTRWAEDLLAQIDTDAECRGLTRSDWLREAAKAFLSRPGSPEIPRVYPAPSDGPVNERLVSDVQQGVTTGSHRVAGITVARGALSARHVEVDLKDCVHPVSRRIGKTCGACGGAV